MRFFEPLPPPPPEPRPDEPTVWRPPLWDRRSEALLGAPMESFGAAFVVIEYRGGLVLRGEIPPAMPLLSGALNTALPPGYGADIDG